VSLTSHLEARPKQLLTRGPRKAKPRKYRPTARVQEGAYFAALLARVSRRLVTCSPARRHSGAIGHQPSSSAHRGTSHQPPATSGPPPSSGPVLPSPVAVDRGPSPSSATFQSPAEPTAALGAHCPRVQVARQTPGRPPCAPPAVPLPPGRNRQLLSSTVQYYSLQVCSIMPGRKRQQSCKICLVDVKKGFLYYARYMFSSIGSVTQFVNAYTTY
jgi:hypothetical protein